MENVLGPCRLPYELLEDDKKIDSGYLLSTRDLCGLDYIPFFINSGVKCLKIEGRMKSPEYVATVTRIYRKYIDLALSGQTYVVNKNDKKELMQVFNRGMSSSGHLQNSPNRNLVFKDKPNNMGLFLGIVEKYNKNKGHISIKLKEPINIGDTIAIENESGTYTISELMENYKNIDKTKIDQTVIIGRMKGNIKSGDKVYKMSSKLLTTLAKESYKKENRKINLNCKISIKKSQPISIHVSSCCNLEIYKDLDITCNLDYTPEEAKNKPLDKETIIKQISKTASTPYQFKNIKIDLDDNAFLPKISILNELRRTALENVENFVLARIHKPFQKPISSYDAKEQLLNNMRDFANNKINFSETRVPKISLLLNELNLDFDYSRLKNIDNIYIPLKYFTSKKYESILKILSQKFDTFIYMPTIVKGNYKNLFYSNTESAVKKYKIKGFVISNICTIKLLNALFTDLDKYFKIVANYTFNIFNSHTVLELKKLGISQFALSPELDKSTITKLCNYSYLQKELIVYGKIPLLNMNYCLLRRN